jgi:hypothetical protein
MRPSGHRGAALATALGLALAATAGCDGSSSTSDDGTGAGGGDLLLSDFEDPAGAVLLRPGNPPTRSAWYAYNDSTVACTQGPAPMVQQYFGETPPSPAPSITAGAKALHGFWEDCSFAGIGADLADPPTPGTLYYTGPRIPYDLSAYKGITFWVMATPGTDTNLRARLPMRAETPVSYGGSCSGSGCGDSWGEAFAIDGTWRQVSIRFDSAGFAQEGSGTVFPWDPRDVIGIQIQSVDALMPYDFWIDDVYLID